MSVRTLIVDDSPVMRAVLSMMLSRDSEIEVVGTADGPETARAMIKQLNPDVLTLDIEMPGMDGLDFLQKIMRLRPMPVVMVSSLTERGSEASIRALEIGAFDAHPKPLFREARDDGGVLARIVKAAARSRARRLEPAHRAPENYRPKADSLIAIGASTGGVEALLNLFQTFPEQCPPTLVVQHMPAAFTRSFAARLDRFCPPRIVLAEEGMPLVPGQIAIAPGGDTHLILGPGRQRRCRLIEGALESGHRPSVDILLASVARADLAVAAGAILTGMGADGAQGLKAMREAGARTFGQDESSSVVYGMPAAAYRAGAVETQLPLGRIAGALLGACAA
ncbi:chemotaxis response regulator protein-glutamate methylesterase [Sphingomonas sp. AP4-R1]|uniref:protein-glutamate methylesterase/protein-glutamine glutaminase n=1 Tax=Sphingomonas sp. AP4-R1 TaxID=2735134 RepID=UPI001493D8FD|nr:chemotaxis response regulator protein-glutamate methylesterase [Sphingomonas sp. AP4-R1]QJU58860.1 chemotaxis response regulator protein-glutamate methylesterase [Sphingomonas sp. AP4-R1]